MDSDILIRLRIDPGRRTLGELLQEREAAASEIENLRIHLAHKRNVDTPARQSRTCMGNQLRVLLRLRDVGQMVGLHGRRSTSGSPRTDFPSRYGSENGLFDGLRRDFYVVAKTI
jgi:hypothetical protein